VVSCYEDEEVDEAEFTNNPFILPPPAAMSKQSFVDSRQPRQKYAPPPVNFSDSYLVEHFARLPVIKERILQGLEMPEQGGLICTDEEALSKQKGVLAHVVKQLAVTLLKGLSISHISLPIKIFEPRSSIQRICDLWSFGP
jgi:hypothetical protein